MITEQTANIEQTEKAEVREKIKYFLYFFKNK